VYSRTEFTGHNRNEACLSQMICTLQQSRFFGTNHERSKFLTSKLRKASATPLCNDEFLQMDSQHHILKNQSAINPTQLKRDNTKKHVRSSVYDCTVTSWCRITSCNIHEPVFVVVWRCYDSAASPTLQSTVPRLDDIARADDMRERRCTTLHHAVTCCPSSPKPKP
jgi:hypothetical protein